MRKGGGKQKGASFEREICTELSLWISAGRQSDVFWRSAMSGGRATVGFKKGKSHASQVGDISAVHALGNRFIDNFGIEVKFYADLNYTGLITGKGKLLDFWDEIKIQSLRYNKHPILFARQNRMQTVVCFDRDGLRKLGLWPRHMLLIHVQSGMYIMSAEKFFNVCAPYL